MTKITSESVIIMNEKNVKISKMNDSTLNLDFGIIKHNMLPVTHCNANNTPRDPGKIKRHHRLS